MSEIDGRFSTVIRKDLRKAFWAMSERGKFINDQIQLKVDETSKTASQQPKKASKH